MREMITTACAGCKEKLERLYVMEELEEEQRMRPCPWCGKVCRMSRYRYSSRKQRKRSPAAGPAPKDRRARYKEPWRGEFDAD